MAEAYAQLTGQIGVAGGSVGPGTMNLYSAIANSWEEHLPKAITPVVTTTDYHAAPWYSDGGAMSWSTPWFWTTAMAIGEALRAVAAGAGDPGMPAQLADMIADPQSHLDKMPTGDQPLLDKQWPWWSK